MELDGAVVGGEEEMAVSGKSPVDEPAILVLSLYPQTKHTKKHSFKRNLHSFGPHSTE